MPHRRVPVAFLLTRFTHRRADPPGSHPPL